MRYGVFVALGLALGLACSLADELEGAACRVEADCDRSQSCVKTLHQLSTGIGTCSSNGGCVAGHQAGCECVDQGCPAAELAAVPHPTERDNNNAPLCFCCPSITSGCGTGQEAVIFEVGADGTARCGCCDSCESGEVFDLDDDGNVVDDCTCVPEDPDGSGTDTDTT